MPKIDVKRIIKGTTILPTKIRDIYDLLTGKKTFDDINLALPNNAYIKGMNDAGDAWVNLIRINEVNNVEFGANINIGNAFWGTNPSVKVTDYMEIDENSPDGTSHGFIWQIDGSSVLIVTKDSDGAGSSDTPQVSVNGNLNVGEYALINKIYHAYGGFQDEAEVINCVTTDVYVPITNATTDLWAGLEADGLTLANDEITFINAGDYNGALSITLSGSNGKDFMIRLYNITQGIQVGYTIGATTTGATNFTNITLPLYIEANAGDVMRMEVACATAVVADPIMRSAVFYLSYLHN